MLGGKSWNFHPDLSRQDGSAFCRPRRTAVPMHWFARNWHCLSERVMIALLAMAAWAWLYPPLQLAERVEIGWGGGVWAANFGLIVAFAGDLRWRYYIRRSQGMRLKFDPRAIATRNQVFSCSCQPRHNMIWTLGCGVTLLTAFQLATMSLLANGYATLISFAKAPNWFLVWLALLPICSAVLFYRILGLVLRPFQYRRVHARHHRNINMAPWSGRSRHPVEYLRRLVALCLRLVVASRPILRFNVCRSGNQKMLWDHRFRAFQNGSDPATARTRARKKRMYS